MKTFVSKYDIDDDDDDDDNRNTVITNKYSLSFLSSYNLKPTNFSKSVLDDWTGD